MKDLTVGKESKLILMFALPMLLGNVFQQLYNVVDSAIVGNFLGKEALSAVGASFPIMFALVSLLIGFTSGSSVIISQYYGAKDMQKVKTAIDTTYIVLFFASIIISILGISTSYYIFKLTGLPEHIIPQAKIYIDIMFAGTITMAGYNGTSGVLRGLGDSKTPLYFVIVSTLVNIGLVFLFVLGFGWGIAGTAAATVIAQGISFFLGIVYLHRSNHIIRFSLKTIKFDRKIFRQSLRIGLPTGFQQMFVALGAIMLFSIVNPFGTDTIAAFTVAGRIDSFALIPAMNFSFALSAFVGQNIGANKIDRVKAGLIATLKMTIVISLIFTAVSILFGRQIMNFFTHDSEVIRIGYHYLVIVSLFYIAFAVMFTFTGIFRGAGDTLIPMFITLMALWLIRIPLSYLLSRHFGAVGIWWGIPIAWVIGTIFTFIYYKTGRWKNKSVVKHKFIEEVDEPLQEKNVTE